MYCRRCWFRGIPACIPTPSINIFIYTYNNLSFTTQKPTTVVYHIVALRKHRETDKNNFNHENTNIRCICILKLCYIFHGDICAFVLTITTAYTAGPHFSRPWNNATNYGNNQKDTLTNARSMTCALCHEYRPLCGWCPGSIIPDCISVGKSVLSKKERPNLLLSLSYFHFVCEDTSLSHHRKATVASKLRNKHS